MENQIRKFKLFYLLISLVVAVGITSCDSPSSNTTVPISEKNINKPAKSKKKPKKKAKKKTENKSSYWSSLQKELNLTDGQINQLKNVRARYDKQMKTAKNKIEKDKFLQQRSKKEVEILGSVKLKKEMNAFVKNWRSTKN